MLCLTHFTPPPMKGKVTACENDGHLRAFPSDEAKQKVRSWLGDYDVEVSIGQETTTRTAYSKYCVKETFISHSESVWQKFVTSYYEEGLLKVLQDMSTGDDTSLILRKVLKVAVKMFEVLQNIKSSLVWPSIASCHSLNYVSQGDNLITNLAWHPHISRLAVVFTDDVIRVYSKTLDPSPILKHRLQKNTTHLEWMPYCSSLLAVACESGILLWTVDPVSVVSRPSGSCLSFLAHPDTLPLSSFSWNPKGLNLVCVGGKGRSLVYWDVATEESSIVHAGIAASLSLVKYSPTGHRLLAALSGPVIKVFECKNWSYERWTLRYPLQSAVWSSDGQYLLFVTSQEPILYCISFRDGEEGVGGSLVASEIADLSALVVTCEDGDDTIVGGLVKELAWDEKSERLAILFQDSKYIALLHTYIHPRFYLAPGGFIRGDSVDGNPTKMCFQSNVPNGSVLTMVWCDGKVTHLPLLYMSHEVRTPFDPTAAGASRDISRGPFSDNVFSTPKASSQSRVLELSINPNSTMGSPIPVLFSSPP